MLTLDELRGLRRMGENTMTCEVNRVNGLIDLINDANIAGKPMAEIGCWLGVSTQTFLHFKPSKLYAIDIWGLNEEYKEANWADLEINKVEEKFRSAMSEYDNVEIIKDFSVNAAKTIADKSLHFVYIDAEHNYYKVMQDIATWLPKIVDGGYIGGHDTCMYDVIYALRDSINTLPRLKDTTYKTYEDTSWLIKIN